MSAARLRMIAGPNGSGKTTLFDQLRTAYSLRTGYWLNPDEIERELARSGKVSFADWGLVVDGREVRSFVTRHSLSRGRRLACSFKRNALVVDAAGASRPYLAAVVADYLRRRWLETRTTFSFETVMSSPDKIRLLRDARDAGYRTYLYYVCTDGPAISLKRVASRVELGGHDVPPDKVASRYERSLALLPEAIAASSRAYLFDNSGLRHQHIAEFENGRVVALSDDLPAWFISHALRKPRS